MTQPLAWGQATDLILAALREIGPCTVRTAADWAEVPYDTARRALQRMARDVAARRRVHICRWTYDGTELERPYLRPVYAIGPGRHADRPPPREYRDVRRESAHRAHNMFRTTHLGVTQRAAVKLRAKLSKCHETDRVSR